ncbi:MAG: hypothetical protein AAF727_07270 [Pseudomonadota bacterium]
MKRIVLIACLGLATPAFADDGADGGLSLMERGAQMLLDGLMREMEPALDELQGLADELGPALRDFGAQMGPAMRDLLTEVEDWSVYEPPVMLENGDIIIRRKPTPPDTAPNDAPGDQIDI